jgi:hypothetical protein
LPCGWKNSPSATTTSAAREPGAPAIHAAIAIRAIGNVDRNTVHLPS